MLDALDDTISIAPPAEVSRPLPVSSTLPRPESTRGAAKRERSWGTKSIGGGLASLAFIFVISMKILRVVGIFTGGSTAEGEAALQLMRQIVSTEEQLLNVSRQIIDVNSARQFGGQYVNLLADLTELVAQQKPFRVRGRQIKENDELVARDKQLEQQFQSEINRIGANPDIALVVFNQMQAYVDSHPQSALAREGMEGTNPGASPSPFADPRVRQLISP